MPLPITFEGRRDELRDVKQQLTAGDAVGVFALEGKPGVGKTALAAWATKELSEDTKAFPGGAIWISCEGLVGEAGLGEVWTRVADAIKLNVSQLPDADARRVAVASALAQIPRRLIALDNVEPRLDADALIDALSIPGHTALLLTARQAVAPAKVYKKELAPLPELDAETLFKRRLHQADDKRPDEKERATAFVGGDYVPVSRPPVQLDQLLAHERCLSRIRCAVLLRQAVHPRLLRDLVLNPS